MTLANASISRSDFIKGGAMGLLGLAGAGALAGCAGGAQTADSPQASSDAPVVKAPDRIIDVHAHLLPGTMNTDYVAWLDTTKTMEDGPSFLWTDSAFEDVENHISEMDRFGIDAEVVTFSSNVPNILKAAESNGLDSAGALQALNDGLHAISEASDGRIVTCAWIDPTQPETALAEMDRMAEKGAKAFGVLTGYVFDGGGHYLDHPRFEPFWAEANKLKLPVFTHFSTRFPINDPDSPLTGFSTENVQNGGVSVLVENTVSAVRLVYSGYLDKYDDLRIVLGQLGGFFPWMFGRYELMHGLYAGSGDKQGVDYRNPDNLDTYLRNLKDYASFFYLDSHSMSVGDIALAQQIMGTDHVMFGSDYPITPAKLGREQPLESLEGLPSNQGLREDFYHGAAENLLGI